MAGRAGEMALCSRICLRQASRHHPPTRSFTSTTARAKHGSLPTFAPTSSPQLDDLLSAFRQNVFLPSHLFRPQRALVYRTKLQHLLLTEDPVTASVSGSDEVHTLKPLSRVKDEPNTRKSLNKVLELLGEGEARDWDCLPGFLEGLKGAGRKISPAMVEKLVRRASEKGRQGTVMECLRRVERTGVVLDSPEVAREVMLGALRKAMQSEWSEEGVTKALKYAEGFLELMEDPRHVQGRRLSSEDLRCRPETIGFAVLLAGVRAVKYSNKKDEDGKIRSYTERMLATWGNADYVVTNGAWSDANYKLVMWSPMWYGLKTAQQVLGENSEFGRSLDKALQDLALSIQKAKDIISAEAPKNSKRRGLEMYSKLASVLE